ncbi:alpha/beta hydrolase [Streptomyces cavernicola]|uniref:Alpha/beta hydrolase n=1 Tax=Streptomyces cavernicola TaxID=3043613 RepID=A0ABT6SCC9_9ACTN|nr:alpha/beta hydrolase [Streptomyces sp. B-S-A6]MDI3405852.1 alpha/beta hydrolase [Streptomyces sp. B-S-A6]
MTSFDSSPTLNVWRALLALAVVFVMLATTGWSAVRHDRGASTPLELALSAWQRGGIDGHKLPDPKVPASRKAHFFDTLTGAQQLRLARSYPLAVGNMAGVPVRLRYAANRVALDQARDVERRRMHDERLSESGRHEAGRRMHRFDSLLRPGRQILAFDPMGPGRVAEVLGDLNRAERVSVVVPGVDTNLLTYQKTNGRYSAPRGMASALYHEQRERSPKTRSAVIAWADYTAPAGLGVDAATAKRAEDGSVRLNSMVRTLPGSSKVALYCHSYGSVVCGVAASELPPRVSDIAVAGSPGMRAGSVEGLHTDARVWAMRDSDDWIQDIPHMEVGGLGHGADPVSESFGARVVSAEGAIGHTGYFQPGTESLRNFARIGVGQYDSVSCADGGEACRNAPSGSASA